METISVDKIATLTYQDNNILRFKMHKLSNIGIDEANQILEVATKLAGNKQHCNLVDISEMAFMTGEARKVFGGQNKSTVSAVGVVMNSKFQRALVNLYQKINRPVIPTKMFDTAEEAEKWLLLKL